MIHALGVGGVIGDVLLVVGGYGSAAGTRMHGYWIDEDRWLLSPLPSMSTARIEAAGSVTGSRLFVFGGLGIDTNAVNLCSEYYDLDRHQ
jgi:N-acetylneuraminic acid mutarotase